MLKRDCWSEPRVDRRLDLLASISAILRSVGSEKYAFQIDAYQQGTTKTYKFPRVNAETSERTEDRLPFDLCGTHARCDPNPKGGHCSGNLLDLSQGSYSTQILPPLVT